MAYTPGSLTKLKATISTVLTEIALVQSVDVSGWSMGTSDITVLASASHQYRTTLPEGGEVSATLLFDPSASTQTFLTDTMGSGALVVYNLVFADAGAAVLAFSAYVTAFDITEIEAEGTVKANVKFKVNGVPVLTP